VSGLLDESIYVRKTIEKEILEKIPIYSILEEYNNRNSQRSSLKIVIKDFMDKETDLEPATKRYFQDILMGLDGERVSVNSDREWEVNRK